MPEDGGGSGSNAFLGKGSRVVGKLTFEGPVRIEGQVEGEITAQDALTIGESAVVNAQIVGNSVVIQGRVTGDVTARKRLEIRAPGQALREHHVSEPRDPGRSRVRRAVQHGSGRRRSAPRRIAR